MKKALILLILIYSINSVNGVLAGSTVDNSYITFTATGNQDFDVETWNQINGIKRYNNTVVLNATNDYAINIVPEKFSFTGGFTLDFGEWIVTGFLLIISTITFVLIFLKIILPYFLKW